MLILCSLQIAGKIFFSGLDRHKQTENELNIEKIGLMQLEYKVLIVDDDEMNVDILKDDLEDKFNVMAAGSGEEALSIIPDFLPNIILLDIMMTGIDGYEVCRRIRADKKNNFIKIILISGRAMENERQKGFEVGADDYITKPFDVDEVTEKIKVLREFAERNV